MASHKQRSSLLYIPEHKVDVSKTKTEAMKGYENKSNDYISLVNKEWLARPIRTCSQLPKLTKIDFSKDEGDLILMLKRVIGSPQEALFKSWMCYYIEMIHSGNEMFDWAVIISENIDEKMRTVTHTGHSTRPLTQST